MAREVGEIVAERYRLGARLGEGGMGEVWSADHTVTGRGVALKFLAPGRTQSAEAQRRFLREARAASRVDHPAVVGVHDVFELDDGSLVMVMDLLVGETLRDHLERLGRLSPRQTATLLLPVISAVGTAHQAGVVHRDLKPENIFLTSRGESKVLDFGIAKLLEKDEVETGLTNTGALLGTPHYMSPEQVFGEKDVDARADVWSLGVILYECLAGERPFEGENPGQVMKAVLIGEQTPLDEVDPELPADLVEAVHRMLELRRRERMSDLVEVFEVLQAHTDVEAVAFSAATGLVGSLPPSSPVDSDPYAMTKLDTGEAWDELRSIAKAELKTGAPVETMSEVDVPRRSRGMLLAILGGAAGVVGAAVLLLRTPGPAPEALPNQGSAIQGPAIQGSAIQGPATPEPRTAEPVASASSLASTEVAPTPTVSATVSASASPPSEVTSPRPRPLPPASKSSPVERPAAESAPPEPKDLPGGVHGEVPF